MKTLIFNTNNTSHRTAQVGDIVYHLNQHGQYKHTLHRVRRVNEAGLAVTCCTIWLRYGAVDQSQDDAAIWCTYGCKPYQEATS